MTIQPTELLKAEQFIYSTLTSDSRLNGLIADRVYSGVVPELVQYPCILINAMSSRDITGCGAYRIATSSLYLVRAIGTGGHAAIDPIAAVTDQLLHGKRMLLDEDTVFSCIREQPFVEENTDGNITFYQRGGLYRVMIRPS